jgi:hypothetical protein
MVEATREDLCCSGLVWGVCAPDQSEAVTKGVQVSHVWPGSQTVGTWGCEAGVWDRGKQGP